MAKHNLTVLFGALVTMPVCLYAGSCPERSLCERLDQARVIFLGEVIEGGVEPGHALMRLDPGIARMRVVEAFRGLPQDVHEVEVEHIFIPGVCSPNPYEHGKRVLVFTRFDERRGVLLDGPCTQSLSHNCLDEEIERVREYFQGKMKSEIHGRIATNIEESSVDDSLESGVASPTAGATVTVEGMGKRIPVRTDSAGRYFVRGLQEGLYRLRAELTGYERRGLDADVRVNQGGCALQNFSLWTTNSVEGFVFDPSGAPVRNIKVLLQRKGSIGRFEPETETDVRGGFRFAQIPEGEYTAVVSPTGETGDSPYPRTVLATPLTLGPTSSIDGLALQLPAPIPTREIRVRVIDREGRDLREGSLTCAQAGKEDIGQPMSEELALKQDGAVCRALADRAYRIWLRRAGGYSAPNLPFPPKAFVAPGLETVEVILKVP